MFRRFLNQTIEYRLIFLLIFLSAIAVNYVFAIVYYDYKFFGLGVNLTEVEKVSSVIGTSKSYSQQISFYALLVKTGDENARKNLNEAISNYDEYWRKLNNTNGVYFVDNGVNMQLPPIPVEVDNTQLQLLWDEFKQKASIIANEPLTLENNRKNPKMEEAINFIISRTAEFYDKNDKFEKEYLAYYDAQQSNRFYWLAVILIFNIAIIIAAFSLGNRFVIRPISKISKINEIVTEGDFEKKIDYDKDDELGRVAIAINTLFDNLKNATDFILDIGEGRLEVEYQRAETLEGASIKQDRLANALLEMRDKMQQVAEQDKQRTWVAEGLAKFADILTRTDEQNFNHYLIANIVDYLEVNQGGLFIVNDDNTDEPYLELIAAYAFQKNKYLEKHIKKGEGLIGEVYQDGKTVYVLEVPQNYVTITSGLGGANPSSLLIVPLKINEEVYGAIELASFQPFPKYKIEFVEKIGENMANTFSSIRTSKKTEVLLQESMQLGEQMRSQEEEMRQNLEELIATQDELTRSKDELEKQKGELENALEDEKLKNEALLTEKEELQKYLDREKERLEELLNQKDSEINNLRLEMQNGNVTS